MLKKLIVKNFIPVRRIPISTVSLTGQILGQEFESSLERDLIMLMAWSDDLDWFQVQPIKITYINSTGKRSRYTPDLLVNFSPNPVVADLVRKPILCEVKYHDELVKNWPELKVKFRAATCYAREQGWIFRIYSEKRIRTTRLENIKFLWSYRQSPPHLGHPERLITILNKSGKVSIQTLLDQCYPHGERIERAKGLWSLWCLIAKQQIQCDLSIPLGMATLIWLPMP